MRVVTDAAGRGSSSESSKNIDRIKIVSPEVLSIYDKNYEATLKFYDRLSLAVFRDCSYVTLDFSGLRAITAAAALILFAHVTRCQNCAPSVAFQFRDRVIDLEFGDNKETQDLFRREGILTALKSGGRRKLDRLWEDGTPFKTHNNPSQAGADILRWVKSVNKNTPPKLIRAISEALLNVSHHSYKGFEEIGRITGNPLDSFMVKRWWQYSCVQNISGAERFVFLIYDMGSGIPFVARNLAASNKDDSEIIKIAMQRGFSSTGILGRGNGSADLLSPLMVDHNDDSLLIYSNKGEVGYRNDSVYEEKNNALSVGGTLLEWSFRI